MFWIRTATGSLFNLATCSELILSDTPAPEGKFQGKHALIAVGPALGLAGPNKGFIAYGSQEELKQIMNAILKKLVAHQNKELSPVALATAPSPE